MTRSPQGAGTTARAAARKIPKTQHIDRRAAAFQSNALLTVRGVAKFFVPTDFIRSLHSSGQLCELFQIPIVMLPGSVHDSNNSWERLGCFEPVPDFFGRRVVITCNDLSVSALSKEFQTLFALFEVPRNNN